MSDSTNAQPGPVQLPGAAVSTASDLLVPLQDLLSGVNVWARHTELEEADGLKGTFLGPPDSVSVIEAGGTALSKWWSVAVGAVGGATALTTGLTKFWDGQSGGARIAVIATCGGLLAAVVIAIAVIVSSDVRGRAAASVAQYQARSQIAVAFLQSAQAVSSTPRSTTRADTDDEHEAALIALASAGHRAAIRHKASGKEGHLGGLQRRADGAVLVRMIAVGADDNDWFPPSEIDTFEYTYNSG